MPAKFACANLAVKFSDANLLNSEVVIYLLWPGVLFSIVSAVVIAKLVILGISFLTSFISALIVVLVAKLVLSGISSSIFLILALYTSFLITLLFTTSLNLLESTGTATILSTSNVSTVLLKLLELQLRYLIYLHQILNELNQFFLVKYNIPTSVASFKPAFLV